MRDLPTLRAMVEQGRGARLRAWQERDAERRQASDCGLQAAALAHQQDILKVCAERGREAVRGQLVPFVTEALRMVKGPGYEFGMEFQFRRDAFETDLWVSDGRHVADPRRASGGGVCDLAANTMLMAYLLAYRPALRRFCLLDERWPNLGDEDAERVAEFLQYLARDHGFQFLIVTHQRDLWKRVADRWWHVSREEGGPSQVVQSGGVEPPARKALAGGAL